MKTIIFIALFFVLTGCEVIAPIANKILMSIAADAVVEAVKESKE